MTNLLDEPISTVGSVSAKTKFPSNLSWDEFLALPQETRNAALIDGEVVVNPPNRAHEIVVRRLSIAFTKWTDEVGGRGEVSTQQPVKVNDASGYQPDFAWYSEAQCSAEIYEPFVGVPALVVEILSPSTRRHDVTRKRVDCLSVGIDELWFVDPLSRAVTLVRRDDEEALHTDHTVGGHDMLTSRLLPGFEVSVSELFVP